MSKFTKLLELDDYADAKPILETVKGLSNSAKTLAQTAYQIKETQGTVARNFLKTVIQECECEEEKTKETDGGKDHQSSSTTGLAKVGSEEQAPEGMTSDTDVKDQMGVHIGEMAPMGGMPPQGYPPQGMPPQGMPRPPMQQMQYTIQEANAIRSQFKSISEAIKSLDKKITETQISSIKSIDVGTKDKGEKPPTRFIRETTDLEGVRKSITQLNNAINNGLV